MAGLAERLLKSIRKQELLRAGDRVAVAVSGGADSVALLLLLVELRKAVGIVLSVAHVNHKLRGAESDGDEAFVSELAGEYGLEFLGRTAAVEREQRSGIEGAARRLRYEVFHELVRENRATKIATAHTLDDQAETVLLRLFRGTGIRGLGGIHPRLRLGKAGSAAAEVVRPLLGFRRAELREFLRTRGQTWREDSSNRDELFLRNRVRGVLLPLIAEEFGDAAIEHMAELAEIARAEEELWSGNARWTAGIPAVGAKLEVDQLLALPLAARRRMVRAWIEANAPGAGISFRLIEEISDLARGTEPRTVKLPGRHRGASQDTGAGDPTVCSKKTGLVVRRGRKELVIEPESADGALDYEYELTVPGEIYVPEIQLGIAAEMAQVESVPEGEREALFDPNRLGKAVVIRNWRAGDRYWAAHTKQEKKIKELLNDRHVTGMDKKLWPVVVSGGEIVWMLGFAAPEKLRAKAGEAIWIRENRRR
jgi:tRNA(Ile)-lysidine synthase